ncbi:MDR family MFS transporter [Promethearchaeum syntrophicum]|uniref:MDR family MFS transporter n=1 Tax=Promethearchaeum syntrophicum TaxID=2594042 RepID=A0A5B9DGR7_9ARCH|nr:MFS transporter [Candidatus Prometheoarchaeum syntrophicum]QEE17923.1 putative transporter [Candidatus Prometheoarchaeum syntrophicum]
MFGEIKTIYQEYPKTFWILMTATFIDRIGGALLFPFFALYITDHFGVGMTEVGILFGLYAAGSIIGGIVGGIITDKYGRKFMLLFGLIASASFSLLMGFIDNLNVFYSLAIFWGLVGDSGGPAQRAMVTDLLVEEKRVEGFGVIKIIGNLAISIGPAIGSFLATRSFLLLFIADAITSLITAIIVFITIPETKPEIKIENPNHSIWQTFIGYKDVLKDRIFMVFMAITALVTLVYMQMNGTLSVFLRDNHSFSTEKIGWLLSMNAGMVVLFQFWITRKVKNFSPMIITAIGTLLYGIGFGMYGFIKSDIMMFIAMIIITIGEMIRAPFTLSIVSDIASEDNRGRYMAVFSFSWTFPTLFGLLVAGTLMDNYNQNLVWYGGGLFCIIGVLFYVLLNKTFENRIILSKVEKNALEIAIE